MTGRRRLHVRDLPEEAHAVLRSRAAAEGISVSAYVRRLIREDTERPTVAEVFARRREPAALADDDIVSAIHNGRR